MNLPTPVIEKRHCLIDGVKNYPVMPYGFFALFTDSLNLGIPKIFKLVVVIAVQFMFSHSVAPFTCVLNADYHGGLTDTVTRV